MLFQHRLDFLEIGARWHNHAARAHGRFCPESSDRLRPFIDDIGVQFFREACREIFFRFARLRIVVVMRRTDVMKAPARDRRIKKLVIGWQARQRSSRQRNAVIALQARNQLFLLRPANRIIHVPDHLDRAVIRLRP